MSEEHKIMYVGNQMTPSADRPNGRPDRIWNGPGDVVGGVLPIQAYALCKHKDEWEDVTKLDDAALLLKAKAVRAAAEDRVRQLRNPRDAPSNARSLDAMTDDELEAEMERRRAARGDIESEPKKTAQPKAKDKPKGKNLPTAISKAIDSIVARVEANSDLAQSLIDDTGLPTHAAVQEECGFSLSVEEYQSFIEANSPK